jgi:uncharacterized membrane protein
MTGADARSEDHSRWSAGGWVLLGAGIGSLAYRIVVDWLLDSGRVDARPELSRAGARDAILDVGPWVALAVGVVLVVIAWRADGPPPRVLWLGGALTGAGGAFTAWSVVDMHGLGLYDWAGSGSDVVPDAVFHGAGALVLALGWVFLTEATRPSRA